MSWQNKPSDFINTVISDCEAHVKDVAKAGLQSIITPSPVQDGYYRGSHRVSIGTEDFGYNPNHTDISGSSTLSDGLSQIVKLKLGSNLFIQTNAPHAVRLENGWSKQAPQGVYSIAFMNMGKYK